MANVQYVQDFLPYVVGLKLSYASSTTLTVGTGQCRDATNVKDLIISSTTTLNPAVNGVNGLDTGTFAKAKWYYVWVIGDSTNANDTATLLSLSASTPLMPSGYDVKRLIGCAQTASGAATFLLFRQFGNGSERQYYWDSSIAVLTTGQATTLTAIDLSTAVPPIALTPVKIHAEFIPATADDNVGFATFGSVATVIPHLSGSVAAKKNSGEFNLLSTVDSGAAKILYINSAGSCTAHAWVSGFSHAI